LALIRGWSRLCFKQYQNYARRGNIYSKNSKQQSILINDIDSIHGACWFYTNGANLSEIQKTKTILETKKFADYPITRLKLDFLLYSKRYKTITYNYLLKIK
jgi:hypothetical protein